MRLVKVNDIISNSTFEDWVFNTLTQNLDHKEIDSLIISKVVQLRCESKNNCWREYCSDNDCHKVEYFIEYNEECIARYYFIEVDSLGVILPLPRHGNNRISFIQLNLAKIINYGISIDAYIKDLKLEVYDNPLF